MPVRLAGDGLCMAVGEHRYGAGRGARFLLGIVVSTGVGGGLVLDGCGYGGRTGNAGHVGHVVVDPAVSRAPAAGAAVSRPWPPDRPGPVARVNGWDAPPGVSAKELADAAVDGNPVAVQAFRHGAEALAATIASVAAVCDLDRVVVGGECQRGPLLFDPLRAALAEHTGLAYLSGLRVLPAELGDNAGLIGAATLAGS
ncbi:ROK family protein [Mycobacterium xenopi 3993]|nr:ROK family protein [Mycobacterium xenopi 3993]